MEQLPRRIKITVYIPLIPTFSLEGEGAGTCVDTYSRLVFLVFDFVIAGFVKYRTQNIGAFK